MASNPIRESLNSGKFFYMVELVATANSREALLMQTASELAQIPEIAAGSVTCDSRYRGRQPLSHRSG